MKPRPIAEMLQLVDQSKERASIIHARVLVALMGAKNFTLSTADLGVEVDRGRDSQAVRDACAHLEKIGLVTREMVSADQEGGRKYLVRMCLGQRE